MKKEFKKELLDNMSDVLNYAKDQRHEDCNVQAQNISAHVAKSDFFKIVDGKLHFKYDDFEANIAMDYDNIKKVFKNIRKQWPKPVVKATEKVCRLKADSATLIKLREKALSIGSYAKVISYADTELENMAINMATAKKMSNAGLIKKFEYEIALFNKLKEIARRIDYAEITLTKEAIECKPVVTLAVITNKKPAYILKLFKAFEITPVEDDNLLVIMGAAHKIIECAETFEERLSYINREAVNIQNSMKQYHKADGSLRYMSSKDTADYTTRKETVLERQIEIMTLQSHESAIKKLLADYELKKSK